VTLTPTGRRRTVLRSQMLLHWRANAGSLSALTGQSATFTRASTASATDANAVSYGPVPNNLPRFTWLDLDGGTRPYLLTESAESEALAYDYPAPLQALTVGWQGRHPGTMADGSVLVQVGEGATLANTPLLRVRWNATAGDYSVVHDNGTASVEDAGLTTTPGTDALIRLVAQLYADGSVQIHQSIYAGASWGAGESGTRTAAPSGGIVTRASGQKLGVGSVGDGDNAGTWAHRWLKIAPGVQTPAAMLAAW